MQPPYRVQAVRRHVTWCRRCSQQYTDTCHYPSPERHSAVASHCETLYSGHLSQELLARSFPNVLEGAADRSCRRTAACGSWPLPQRPSARLQYLAVLNSVGKRAFSMTIINRLKYRYVKAMKKYNRHNVLDVSQGSRTNQDFPLRCPNHGG